MHAWGVSDVTPMILYHHVILSRKVLWFSRSRCPAWNMMHLLIFMSTAMYLSHLSCVSIGTDLQVPLHDNNK